MESRGTNKMILNKRVIFTTIIGFLIIFSFIFTSKAQIKNEQLLITGYTKNSETKEIVSYAHVRLNNTHTGVNSNGEGFFWMNIPGSNFNDSLKITAIGFHSKTISIKEFLNSKKKEIYLEETSYLLDDITLSVPGATTIVKNALKRRTEIQSNAYSSTAYYRTAYRENGTFVRFLEAYIDLLEDGKNFKGYLQPKIKELRKSKDFRRFKWKENSNYLISFLKGDYIKSNGNPIVQYPEFWNYEYIGSSKIDDQEVHIIKAVLGHSLPEETKEASEKYEMVFYIRSHDYSIARLSYDFYWDINEFKGQQIDSSLMLYRESVSVTTVYEQKNEINYLSYQTRIGKWILKELDTKEILAEIEVNDELIVDQLNTKVTKGEQRLFTYSLLDANSDIYDKRIKYNKDFWEKENHLAQTDFYKQIIADIETQEANMFNYGKNSKE